VPETARSTGRQSVKRWIGERERKAAALCFALLGCAVSARVEAAPPPASMTAEPVKASSSSASSAPKTPPPTVKTTPPVLPGARDGDHNAVEYAPQIVWKEEWPRFRMSEYVATGIFAAASFAALVIPPSESRWRGITTFDREARSALRFSSQGNRDVARDTSDLLLSLLTNQLLFDTFVVTWWSHGRGSVAWEMGMINLEAIALNGAINGLIAGFASRERPYREACVGPEERQIRDCRESKRYRSFFSGHTSTSFTSAGLMCAHHANLPLYGGGAAEAWMVCLGGFATAATVGLMRVMSDQHFMSDVLTGAAIGTAVGLGVPWLLHYRGGARASDAPAKAGSISIQFIPTLLGGSIVGGF
jgi:membrane-associated phospholipid phosphatase